MSVDPPLLPVGAAAPARPALTATLSVAWIIFLGSGVVLFLSDALILAFGRNDLAGLAALGFAAMLLTGFVLFGLMALRPEIPKPFFLPIALFLPVAIVAALPLHVYFWERAHFISAALSLGQVLLALLLLRRWQGGLKFRWPLFPAQALGARKFSWGNVAGVLALGLVVILPASAFYTAFSAKLAVEHLSDDFIAVRASGIAMQVRHYARDDGKKVVLVPMVHVGEPEFYRELAASFPAHAVILMEGVTDNRKTAKARFGYSRIARSLGVVGQGEFFRPKGEIVAADLDMSAFSAVTLDFLKSVALLEAKGVTRETLPVLLKPRPPGWERQMQHDLLTKRNHHLLGVIRERLPASEVIVVPWGAAHLPEIQREILKLGFRVTETKDYVAIRFGSRTAP